MQMREDFSSVESLRTEFISTANAMFGPGFVWLVSTERCELRVLATYIAGSPYAGAHFRMQPVDMATQNASATGAMRGVNWAQQQEVNNSLGAFGRHSRRDKVVSPGGLELTPLLCVNTWEHVWLRDYGIAGKKVFLENWWDRINWDVVLDDFPRKEQIGKAARRHGGRENSRF